MIKVHHNTLKRAVAHGIELKEMTDGQCGAFSTQTGNRLAVAADPKDALDLALLEIAPVKIPKIAPVKLSKPKKTKKSVKRKAKASAAEDDEEGEGEAPRSIVKAKYRAKYRPHKMTNGDAIAKRVHAEFMTRKDPDSSKPRLDFARFVKFAQQNGCWVEGYRSLKDRHGNRNNGLIRMNVINRLRALVRKKVEINWEVK